MSCHVSVVSRRVVVVSCRVALCRAAASYVMSLMSCHVMRHACYDVSCLVTECHVMSYIMSFLLVGKTRHKHSTKAGSTMFGKEVVLKACDGDQNVKCKIYVAAMPMSLILILVWRLGHGICVW